jgi:hypothetical protein
MPFCSSDVMGAEGDPLPITVVNDFNQHLCGGWHTTDIEDANEETVQQLLARLHFSNFIACIVIYLDVA